MFIFDTSVSAAKQAEEIRKAQEAEEARKAREAEAKELKERQEATEKKAAAAKAEQDKMRGSKSVDKNKAKEGIPGLSDEGMKDRVTASSKSGSGKLMETLKSELDSLDSDAPSYEMDKRILKDELDFQKQAAKDNKKFESGQKQKELNAGYKAGNGYNNRFSGDVNLDPGVQKQREKTLDKADRILNEPGYAGQLAHNRNHTSTFGDPSVSSWARDRMRLGEMDKQKGSSGASAGNHLAGGDIDFKNAKGSVSNIAGKRFYAPDKNKPDDVYEVKRNPLHDLHENHQIVKQMIDGTLDEDGMKNLGLEFKKTSYDTELAQHKERKAKGILTPEQTERKQEALASAKSRKETLEAMVNNVPTRQAQKIQGKLDRISNLIAKQEAALGNSSSALASATPEQLDLMGLEDKEKLAKADAPKKAEELAEAKEAEVEDVKEAEKLTEEEKQEEDKQTIASLKSELSGAKDPGKIKDLISKLNNIDVADDSGKTALMYAAESGLKEAMKAVLDKKPDVNKKDNESKAAIDYAKDEETQNALVGAGAELKIDGGKDDMPTFVDKPVDKPVEKDESKEAEDLDKLLDKEI